MLIVLDRIVHICIISLSVDREVIKGLSGTSHLIVILKKILQKIPRLVFIRTGSGNGNGSGIICLGAISGGGYVMIKLIENILVQKKEDLA